MSCKGANEVAGCNVEGIEDIDDGSVETDCIEAGPWEITDHCVVVAADAIGGVAGVGRGRGLRSEEGFPWERFVGVLDEALSLSPMGRGGSPCPVGVELRPELGLSRRPRCTTSLVMSNVCG